MKSKITFTVEPSEDHQDVLIIRDAFQQAVDFFDLLTDDADKNIAWKLDMASTNSPFTCAGEPIDIRTWAGASGSVANRVSIVERNLKRIADGLDFDDDFPREKREIARKILKRNTNGISRIVAVFDDNHTPLEITHDHAVRYFNEIETQSESLHSYLFSTTSRKEYGSVEGRIMEIGTDYDLPAIHLVEHKTNRKIWCRVSTETAERLSDEIKAGDAWTRRRVRVRGVVNYDDQGKIIRLIDGAIAFIEEKEFDLDKLSDPTFTGRFGVREYLDRLQENEFGKQ